MNIHAHTHYYPELSEDALTSNSCIETGNRAGCIWLTGLSGAGKTTIAQALIERLRGQGRSVFLLDGDVLRMGLCSDLGFSVADRAENIRRVGHVARLLVDAGQIVVVSLISPLRAEREVARALFAEHEFLKVFVDAPVAVCEGRDVKGLYARARRGEIPNFTGIDSPYEAPLNPDVHLHTDVMTLDECVNACVEACARVCSDAAREQGKPKSITHARNFGVGAMALSVLGGFFSEYASAVALNLHAWGLDLVMISGLV